MSGAAAPAVQQAGERRDARIEGLRALAALAVLTGHAFAWARDYRWEETTATFADRAILGGGFGVYLFFALSGYLLYLPFARRDFATGTVDLRRYGRNRALRILPLYWVSVAVLLVAQEGGGTTEQWWRFLLFAQELSEETAGTVNPVLWSLVVELQFYVLLPALAWIVARAAGDSLETAATFLAMVGAASFAIYALEPPGAVAGADARGSLPATLFFFAGGMLVALLRVRLDARAPGLAAGALGRPWPWLAASVPLWVAVVASYDLAALAAPASALVVAACVLPPRADRAWRLLSWRPLALLGVASYSLYIWHLQVIEALHREWDTGFPVLLALSLAVCVPLALASYALVEAPALRLRRRWSESSPAPAVRAPSEA